MEIIAAEDHKVAGGLSPDIVKVKGGTELTGAMIQIGGGKTAQNRLVSFEVFAQQGGGKILEAQSAAQGQEFKIGLGGDLQLFTAFDLDLLPEFGAEIDMGGVNQVGSKTCRL